MEGSTSDKQVSLSPNGYQDVKLDMDLHLNNHNNSGHHNHSPPKGLLSSGGSSGGSSSSTQMSHRSPSDSHSDEDDLTGDDNNLYPQYPSPTSNGYAGGVSSATGTCREAHSSCCKTTLAFLFLFYNMTLNLFILAIVHERVPLQIKEPLPDIAFDALPSADRALDVAEYIIVSQVTLVFILLFIHKHRYVLLSDVMQTVNTTWNLKQCHNIQETVYHNGCPLFIQRNLYDINHSAPSQSKLLLFTSGMTASCFISSIM